MSAPVQSGDVLDGKYRVEKVLGIGGMGVVVAATHLHLDQKVAIKFLLPEAVQDANVVARFAREARAAAKIQSEHVARVIDVSTLPTGAPYMVMEYLDGSDLSHLIEARGALSINDAVDYLLQACEALAEAHAVGIIHRDLKPANLFLARRADGGSIVKVLDFGISKLSDTAEAAMTKTASVMGSPLYMSPEQLKSSRNVDARSDIWALGVILHELLSGRVPFTADTMPQLCAMILTEPPPPLRQVRPDAPAELEAIILRCIQQDPNRRFNNVAELAAALCMFGSAAARESAGQISRVLQSAGMLGVVPSAPAMAPAFAAATQLGPMPPMSVVPMQPGASTGTAWGHRSQSAVTGPTQIDSSGRFPVAAPAKSKVPAILLVSGGVLAVLVTLAGVGSRFLRHPSADPALAATSAAAVVSAPVPATAAPDPSTMHLTINARPPDAKIFVDDAEVGKNPYSAKLRKDGSSHKVRIEAPGYATQQKFAVFDKDLEIEVQLVAEAGTDPKPTKAAAVPAPAQSGKPAKKMYEDPW